MARTELDRLETFNRRLPRPGNLAAASVIRYRFPSIDERQSAPQLVTR